MRFIAARREIERLTWLEQGKALVAARLGSTRLIDNIEF